MALRQPSRGVATAVVGTSFHQENLDIAMASSTHLIEAPHRLRAFVRAHEASLVAIAALIGLMAGVLVAAMGAAVTLLHSLFFGLRLDERLSAQQSMDPARTLIVLTLGGFMLGIAFVLVHRWRPGREVDPIEANALHGGQMSLRGSMIVALQTIWSSGVGASVGMEAGYTQIASGTASAIGHAFRLRRADQRIMVGCGAAAAIAGAFGAPLAGAFYAFELILGAYTPRSLAAIGVAALAGYMVAHALAFLPLGVIVSEVGEVSAQDLAIAGLLGLCAALCGIMIMRGVTLGEALLSKGRLWRPFGLAIGGLIVGSLALVTPQVLSSGHGALHLAGMAAWPLSTIGTVFVLKAIASIVSLGCGFRGGLFFSSLLVGALGGHLFAAAIGAIWPDLKLDPNVYAVIGMSALSASVVGGPLTMSFIALETTGNLWLTSAVLVAVIISAQTTRELFGYSFATWRLHLRGETIRSAADVGWLRDLTARAMMRGDVATVNAETSIAEFCGRFALGAKTQVVAVDEDGHYVGIIFVAEAHGPNDAKAASVKDILHYRGVTLLPDMNIKQVVAVFDWAEAESLAVVDESKRGHVIGILTEAHVLRRYAEELERRRRDIIGES
jgi:chloride channel protein, CIC family